MRVGWDVDGVGFNFGDSVYRALCAEGLGHLWKSGPNPDPYWDFFRDWGWDINQFIELCNRGADAGIIFSGPVREGYAEGIEAVASMGHEIIIATDRSFGTHPGVSEQLTVEWLEQHGIEYDELIFTRDKTDANCDFFIDDKLENYDALIKAGTKAYLLNRKWNYVPGGDGRLRINTIDEFVDAVAVATELGYADLHLA